MRNEDIQALKSRAKINDKIVELSLEDFNSLIEAIQMCRENEKKLKEAVMFLNNQISNYNKKFTN